MAIFMLRMIYILIKIIDHLYLCLSSIKYIDTIEKKIRIIISTTLFLLLFTPHAQ